MPSARASLWWATNSPNVIARSYISRTTDFGDSPRGSTHGWGCR